MKTFLCIHYDICHFDAQNVLMLMQYLSQKITQCKEEGKKEFNTWIFILDVRPQRRKEKRRRKKTRKKGTKKKTKKEQ